jgi:two-component system sensor histidine kinase KdpD
MTRLQHMDSVKPYYWTALGIAFITATGKLITPFFSPTNVAFLYLLPVLLSAVYWGRGVSLFGSFLGVLTFDFFFVPPVFSFAVSDVKYVFTFGIFLLVGIVTGSMATRLRNELEKAKEREKRLEALYSLSRQIGAKADLNEMLKTFLKTLSEAIGGQVALLMPAMHSTALREVACYPSCGMSFSEKEKAVMDWVLEHGRPAGRGTETLRRASPPLFPVKADNETLGVLVVDIDSDEPGLPPDRQQVVEAFANLAGVAIARVRLAEEAEQSRWLAESEKVHRALLLSVSHDLRTPLASITGGVTGLLLKEDVYDREATRELLDSIRQGASRLNRIVRNLLDMARLESGTLRLNREWCDVQDLVGVALRETEEILQGHKVNVAIPLDLSPVKADFGLLLHVMINLLENAGTHGEENGEISISATPGNGAVFVSVADQNPAIPRYEREHLFDKFYRLQHSGSESGTGLGLSICRAIMEAHGGMIWIDSLFEQGNIFTFALPLEERPAEWEAEEGENHAA